MNIADLILALQKGGDPNAVMLASAQADAGAQPGPPGIPPALASLTAGTGVASAPKPPTPPPGASGVTPPPPPPAAPAGTPTPVTNPIPSEQAPRIMQSPPDLSNMYLQLMKDNRNAALMDSGASLVAAGFSKYPENRAALIAGANKAGSGQNMLSSEDIVRLQGLQVKGQELQLRQAAKAGLMKKYGLDRDTTDYLDASGKLDEVIKHKNTQNLTLVESADGSKQFYDPIGGKPVGPVITPPKAEEGQWVEGPNGPELRSKKDGRLMGGGALGLKPSEDERARADINKQRKDRGLPEVTTEEFLTTIKRPPQQAANAQDEENLASINRDNALANKPPMSMETYLTTVKRSPGVTVNVSPDGVKFPDPQPGQDYIRTPDGKVKVFEDGKPRQYTISGSTAEQEAEKKRLDIAEKTKEQEDLQKKETKKRVNESFAASNVGSAVDTALSLTDRWGAAGVGSKIVRGIPIGGMPWDTLDAKLDTIKSNVGFQELQKMRDASPTGAGLGPVSDFENKLLSSTTASLATYQDPAELKKGLIRIKAAFHVLATNKYDDKNPETEKARFNKDLNDAIREFTVEADKVAPSGKNKVREISR